MELGFSSSGYSHTQEAAAWSSLSYGYHSCRILSWTACIVDNEEGVAVDAQEEEELCDWIDSAVLSVALVALRGWMSIALNQLELNSFIFLSLYVRIAETSPQITNLGCQLATVRCIMFLGLLKTAGLIAIIIVKLVYPDNKETHVPGFTPPARGRQLLSTPLDLE